MTNKSKNLEDFLIDLDRQRNDYMCNTDLLSIGMDYITDDELYQETVGYHHIDNVIYADFTNNQSRLPK